MVGIAERVQNRLLNNNLTTIHKNLPWLV